MNENELNNEKDVNININNKKIVLKPEFKLIEVIIIIIITMVIGIIIGYFAYPPAIIICCLLSIIAMWIVPKFINN